MRVLVVGATGFVGGRLVESLCSAGHEVVAFSRSASRSTFPDEVEIFEGDLGDPASLVHTHPRRESPKGISVAPRTKNRKTEHG